MDKPLEEMDMQDLTQSLAEGMVELSRSLTPEAVEFFSKRNHETRLEIARRMLLAEKEHEELERLREEVEKLRLLVHKENVPDGFYRCPSCRQLWPIGSAHYCTGNPDYNGKAGLYVWTRNTNDTK